MNHFSPFLFFYVEFLKHTFLKDTKLYVYIFTILNTYHILLHMSFFFLIFFLETKYFIHIKKSTKSKITKIFIMFLTGIKIPIMSKLFNMQLPNGRSSLTKIGTQLIVRKLKKQKQKKKQKKTKSIPAHMRSLPRIPLPRTGMKVKPRKF